MPTPEKENQVEEIRSRLSRCTIAIATGYQGVTASGMTDLRARLREQGIEYRVIKNTLTIRAANALGKEGVGNVLIGPTALAFGYGDATAAAKGFTRTLRLPGRHWLFTGRLWMGVSSRRARLWNWPHCRQGRSFWPDCWDRCRRPLRAWLRRSAAL